jgi:hypothetical protein
MTNSRKRNNIRNNRDEWTLVTIAIVLPIFSLLSISF